MEFDYKQYYESDLFKQLLFLPKELKNHHFRFNVRSDNSSYFLRIRDRLYTKEDLLKWVKKVDTLEIFKTPTKWLNPVYVGKDKRELDVILSSPLYIDIDIKEVSTLKKLKKGLDILHKTVKYLLSEYSRRPDEVIFSGNRGFHIIIQNWDWETIRMEPPKKRLVIFKKNRKLMLVDLDAKNIILDKQTSIDPYRILRIPGSLNIKSNYPAFKLSNSEISSDFLFLRKYYKIKRKLKQFRRFD